jgi:CheY-like chemotaxis protein
VTRAAALDGLEVLAVVQDPALSRVLSAVAQEEKDVLRTSTTVEGALELTRARPPAVVFLELAVEGGAGLALCHHLPALAPGVEVHVIASTQELERGGEALSLGASGVIVLPVTGDAIARVLSAVKARACRASETAALEQRVATSLRRIDVYDRLVRFARGAAPSEAVRAIAEGVAQLSSAAGVALYATFGDEKSERVRLAASGTAVDLPSTSAPADLARLVALRSAKVVPLVAAGSELGILVLEGMPASADADVGNVADLAAAMLAFIDRHDRDAPRLGAGPSSFLALAERLLGVATRHGRRASLLAISFAEGERSVRRDAIAAEIGEIVRATDALSGNDDGDLLLFLPETGALGAHACRRRIAARLGGDRRARSRGGPARGPESSRRLGSPVSVGVAAFPHDGTSLLRLVRSARTRAREDAVSSVHVLGLDLLALDELVDTLLARPMIDAGPRSPLPLDVASTALFSLVTRACEEGKRGGAISVTTTLQPGLGVAAAARSASSPRVLDVRAQPSCEDIEAVVVEAEHGTWVCCGRLRGDRFHGVHAADPLLADILVRRLTAAGGALAG